MNRNAKYGLAWFIWLLGIIVVFFYDDHDVIFFSGFCLYFAGWLLLIWATHSKNDTELNHLIFSFYSRKISIERIIIGKILILIAGIVFFYGYFFEKIFIPQIGFLIGIAGIIVLWKAVNELKKSLPSRNNSS